MHNQMHARMRISAEDIGGCRMTDLRPIRDGENGLRNHPLSPF